jgi:hypothetical protein
MPQPAPPSFASTLVAAPAQGALCLFDCACDAWADYVQAITSAANPVAVMEANTRLVLDSLELCSRATGSYLVRRGVDTPLLNDA